jgi:hypothetical protein
MINIFSVSTHKGFGIGTSLIQAIKHYEEHNGKLEDNVQVMVFRAQNAQDITVSGGGLEWQARNGAQIIIQLSGLTRIHLSLAMR